MICCLDKGEHYNLEPIYNDLDGHTYKLTVTLSPQAIDQNYLNNLSSATNGGFGAQVLRPLMLTSGVNIVNGTGNDYGSQASLAFNGVCTRDLETLSNSDIYWEYIEKAEAAFPALSQQIASINTTTPFAWANAQIRESFGIASTPSLGRPSNEDDRVFRQRLAELKLQQVAVDALLQSLKAAHDNNAINSPEAQKNRQELLELLIPLEDDLRDLLASQLGVDLRIRHRLTQAKVKFVLYRVAFELMADTFRSGSDLKPMHDRQLNSIVQLLMEIDKVGRKIPGFSDDDSEVCEVLSSPTATNNAVLTAYLTEKLDNTYRNIFDNLEAYLPILINKPSDHVGLGQVGKQTRLNFVEVYRNKNLFTEVCDSCVIETRRQELMSGKPPKRAVTNSELLCRLCKMKNDEPALNRTKRVLQVRSAFKNFVPNLKEKSVAYSLITQGTEHTLVVAYSGLDKLSEDQIRVLKSKIIENHSIKNDIRLKEIILAKAACAWPSSPIPIFDSLKNSGCSSDSDNPALQNDAEIKILESLSRDEKAPKDQNGILTPYIVSDRLTCEYCQEVDFRLSYIGTPIVGEINTNKTAIRPNGPGQRLMSGGLVYGGERLLTDPDSADYSLSAIENILSKGAMCSHAGF
jgi:hypothetical protein